MLSKIINLTLLLVMHEIEEVLNDYPGHPYQLAFSSQALRHKLILRVLNQLPNYYTIVEDSQELSLEPPLLYSSEDDRVFMKTLVCQGIVDVFRENANSISSHIPQANNPDNKSSHWLS